MTIFINSCAMTRTPLVRLDSKTDCRHKKLPYSRLFLLRLISEKINSRNVEIFFLENMNLVTIWSRCFKFFQNVTHKLNGNTRYVIYMKLEAYFMIFY